MAHPYNGRMGLRLGIDLDGVVADFNAGWIATYNEEFEADLPFDIVRVWDGIHAHTHFTDPERFWDWVKTREGGSIFRHLEPYEEAVPALTRLTRAGHDVVIITTKPDWAVHDTFAWIAEHRIPTHEVHMTREKWQVPCDVYLDDAPHQLTTIHAARPDALTCRFVRPWNDPLPGVLDVEDWASFETAISSLVPGPRRAPD